MIDSEQAEGYRVVGGRADAGLVILCDHASNALPEGYGTLGLDAAELRRHIAYDIGAEAIAERLAAALGAPAVFTRTSRLLIDPNRGEDDPTLIMRLSDGAVIPGNKYLPHEERAHRIERYWRPYHSAVDRVVSACVQQCRASGQLPLIFSVHSMTHAWKGVPRPWQVSILWRNDFGLAEPLLQAFRASQRWTVGDNEPYAGGLEGDTLWQHAHPLRLPNAVIEYRQDLVADESGQAQWADITADILRDILRKGLVAGTRPMENTHMSTNKAESKPVASEVEREAAAFRKLVAHLRQRTDVQNIDLMNMAGFCRNCLANWYQEAAAEQGATMDKDQARAHIYGMPYKEWQAKYQTEATAAQKAAFEQAKPHKH
jgi:predicted N-formylglutamate amidohydrolase